MADPPSVRHQLLLDSGVFESVSFGSFLGLGFECCCYCVELEEREWEAC